MSVPSPALAAPGAALDPDALHQRLYAGVLSKTIGVRLGAPLEPTIWTYERIRAAYGEVGGYLKNFRTFAADDTNSPLYFIRVLRDAGLG